MRLAFGPDYHRCSYSYFCRYRVKAGYWKGKRLIALGGRLSALKRRGAITEEEFNQFMPLAIADE